MDNYGGTPLHNAACNGHLDVCKLIIEEVGKKNPGDNRGETPLHNAACNGHFDVCKLIITVTEDKNPVNNFGVTPLHRAAWNFGHLDVCKLIIENVQNKNPAENFKGIYNMSLIKCLITVPKSASLTLNSITTSNQSDF